MMNKLEVERCAFWLSYSDAVITSPVKTSFFSPRAKVA